MNEISFTVIDDLDVLPTNVSLQTSSFTPIHMKHCSLFNKIKGSRNRQTVSFMDLDCC